MLSSDSNSWINYQYNATNGYATQYQVSTSMRYWDDMHQRTLRYLQLILENRLYCLIIHFLYHVFLFRLPPTPCPTRSFTHSFFLFPTFQFSVLKGYIPSQCIVKSDQWILLTRTDAEAVLTLPDRIGGDILQLFKKVRIINGTKSLILYYFNPRRLSWENFNLRHFLLLSVFLWFFYAFILIQFTSYEIFTYSLSCWPLRLPYCTYPYVLFFVLTGESFRWNVFPLLSLCAQ